MTETAVRLKPILDFFPLPTPRDQQTEALQFIQDAVLDNYTDIVIAAPTGIGKSAIGAATTLWAASFDLAGFNPGGYYLVTQKLLQDQLENDFNHWLAGLRNSGASLKSSTEYPCAQFGNCMLGSLLTANAAKSHKKCDQRVHKTCPYVAARAHFNFADMAVTNYPFLFTEHMYVGKLEPRNFLVADECHTLERQITGFIEVVVNAKTVEDWAPDARPIPKTPHIEEFVAWLRGRYLRICNERLNMLSENLTQSDTPPHRMQDEFNRLKNHVGRLTYAIDDMTLRPDEWVYWQEEKHGSLECTAKPISAGPFMDLLINEMGQTRLYLSAYPGPKDVFCRSLNLNPRRVAWLDMDSPFPVDNRLIHMTTVGSMSRTWIEQTTPKLLKMCETILEAHPREKGIIHCHSYALGQRIHDHFRSNRRVLFASRASERATHFNRHRASSEPTVMLSPSISEGFSFDDDLARFQIIAKVPYPYLGDRQVAAKMEIDRDWYTLQTVMSIVQACGRSVRSETDHASTYILDYDFVRLYEDNQKFFPRWFKSAFVWYNP